MKLKTPLQGRDLAGRVLKNNSKTLTVGLSNGFYAELPVELWEHNNKNE